MMIFHSFGGELTLCFVAGSCEHFVSLTGDCSHQL
jgi:hypothetical protein